MAEQVKFTEHEANLIKVAFKEFEKAYGRFSPAERKDLVNIKEALVHLHNVGLVSTVQHKVLDALLGYKIEKKAINEYGNERVIGYEYIKGKLETVAGKKIKTPDEIEREKEIAEAQKAAEERARIHEEQMKRIAEQEAKVREEQEKLLETQKEARQADKANIITGKEEATIDIDSILDDL